MRRGQYGEPTIDHLPQLRLSVTTEEYDEHNIIVRHNHELAHKVITLYGKSTDRFIEACDRWFDSELKRLVREYATPTLLVRVEFYTLGPQRYVSEHTLSALRLYKGYDKGMARESMRSIEPLLRYFSGTELPVIDRQTWRQKLRLCWWILRRSGP